MLSLSFSALPACHCSSSYRGEVSTLPHRQRAKLSKFLLEVEAQGEWRTSSGSLCRQGCWTYIYRQVLKKHHKNVKIFLKYHFTLSMSIKSWPSIKNVKLPTSLLSIGLLSMFLQVSIHSNITYFHGSHQESLHQWSAWYLFSSNWQQTCYHWSTFFF